jgi:hypothetical protein
MNMHADNVDGECAAVPAGAGVAAAAIPSAFDVASSVRKWAVSKNLIAALPEKDETASLANVPAATFGDEQETVLRARIITGIAFAEHARRVIVYTKRKLTRREQKLFPGHINGCSLEFSSGSINDLGNESATAQGATYYVIHAQNADRYTCGSSISPGNCASAGTLGALVREPTSGALFGLTNNHVSGCCSHSEVSSNFRAIWK